jgi:hypothetical protein
VSLEKVEAALVSSSATGKQISRKRIVNELLVPATRPEQPWNADRMVPVIAEMIRRKLGHATDEERADSLVMIVVRVVDHSPTILNMITSSLQALNVSFDAIRGNAGEA